MFLCIITYVIYKFTRLCIGNIYFKYWIIVFISILFTPRVIYSTFILFLINYMLIFFIYISYYFIGILLI
nr:MAG TPA: hypothetical protein [Caudoviricetes sp.]